MNKVKINLSYLVIFAKFCITAFILYQLISMLNFSEIMKYFRASNLAIVFIAFLLIILHMLFISYRWRLIISLFTIQLPVVKLFKYLLIGHFFRNLFPFFLTGDIVRVWLCAEINFSVSKAAFTVVVDRISGIAGLLLISFSAAVMSEFVHPTVWAMLGLFFFSGVVVCFLYVFFLHKNKIILWQPNRPTFKKIESFFYDVDRFIMNVIIKSPINLIKIMILSLASNFMILLSMYSIAVAVDCPITFLQALLYFPIVLLAAFIPLSIGGWGVREGAMIFIFSFLLLPSEMALTISVIFGVLSSLIGLVGAPLWLLHRSSVQQNEKISAVKHLVISESA